MSFSAFSAKAGSAFADTDGEDKAQRRDGDGDNNNSNNKRSKNAKRGRDDDNNNNEEQDAFVNAKTASALLSRKDPRMAFLANDGTSTTRADVCHVFVGDARSWEPRLRVTKTALDCLHQQGSVPEDKMEEVTDMVVARATAATSTNQSTAAVALQNKLRSSVASMVVVAEGDGAGVAMEAACLLDRARKSAGADAATATDYAFVLVREHEVPEEDLGTLALIRRFNEVAAGKALA